MKHFPKKEDNQTNDDNKHIKHKEPSKQNKQIQISALQKQLLKKIYSDLFQSDPSFYQEKELTYENFLYYFYNDIISIFDTRRNDTSFPYEQLLKEVHGIIAKQYPLSNTLLSMNPLQQKRLSLLQKQKDDWAIVSKYQTQLHQEEEKRQLVKIAQSLKDYYQSISTQIEEKKNYEKDQERKRQLELQAKLIKQREALSKKQLSIKQNITQLMKNEEYLSLENKTKFKSKLTREVIVNQSLHDLLKESDKITNESVNLIQYKLVLIANEQQKAMTNKASFLPSEIEISKVVDQIMKQKEDQRLYKTIIKTSDDIDVITSKTIKCSIVHEMEEKVNEIIKTKMRENITKGTIAR